MRKTSPSLGYACPDLTFKVSVQARLSTGQPLEQASHQLRKNEKDTPGRFFMPRVVINLNEQFLLPPNVTNFIFSARHGD